MDMDDLRLVPLDEEAILPCATVMARSQPWIRYGVRFEAAEALWRGALRDGATVTVARLAGRSVGFAWYIQGGGFGLSGYLKLLGIDVAARGRGIGTALLVATERRALADGQRDLILLVSDFNRAAQAFYRRHGYARAGALPDYVTPGIAELIYRKRLD